MNQYLMAYTNIKRMTASPREIEADALTRGAEKLIECCERWDDCERQQLLKDALKYNQKLWTIFQKSLTAKDNPLPKDLKINVMKLGVFIDRQIFLIIAEPSLDKIRSIIDINLSLAKGLSVKVRQASV